jgi:hypothetical protein
MIIVLASISLQRQHVQQCDLIDSGMSMGTTTALRSPRYSQE